MVGSDSSNEERGPLRSLLNNAFTLTQDKYPRLARALKKVGTTTANHLRWAGFQNADEVKRWCDGKIKSVDLVLLKNDSICQQSGCTAAECVAASRRTPKRRSASVATLVAQIARTWALPGIISLSSYLGRSPKPPAAPLALGLRAVEDQCAGQDESPPAGAGLTCALPPSTLEDPARP
eukprot:CAMPEP_0172213354 /NCGR_PEP_ID=MMETSP1050-20130122/37543_1 /TAXON_ID=233186 /ORGANISM="Cryptomonas curvata, Strain CCAP979/52" /LENGTH=178 /DNA_ID=CAMNT_0012894171 /DNA_START=140 /DNA_END=673 /DNA_ORIENTATION=-